MKTREMTRNTREMMGKPGNRGKNREMMMKTREQFCVSFNSFYYGCIVIFLLFSFLGTALMPCSCIMVTTAIWTC